MRKIITRLVRANPVVHRVAGHVCVFVENRYGRYRRFRDRQSPPQLRAVRRVIPGPRKDAEAGSPHVLFVSTRGWSNHQIVDALIAHGLRLRGARCTSFTCGGGLALCDITSEEHGLPPKHCEDCRGWAMRTADAFRTKRPVTLKELLSAEEMAAWRARAAAIEDPATYLYGDVPLGELCGMSLRWVLGRDELGEDPQVQEHYRNIVISGGMLVDAFERLLDRERPDRIFLLSGLFFSEQIMMYLAMRRGIPVTSYESGQRAGTFVFAHDVPSNRMLMDKYWPTLAQQPLTPPEAAELDQYLGARWKGGGGTEIWWPTMDSDQQRIRERLNIPARARIVVAFTNLVWDTAVLGRHRVFTGMMEWLRETIEFFGQHRPDDILVIRVHPAEFRRPQKTNETVSAFLSTLQLPPNVRVVGPDQDVSSYELARMSDLGLVYTSTIGLEMALMGRSAIAAGEAFYIGKGFMPVLRDVEHYRALLASGGTPPTVSDEERELARRYSYALWFRYHVEFPWVLTPSPANTLVKLDNARDFEPGQHPDFDLVCNAILQGRDILELRSEPQRANE